jgi:rubredoxin
LNPVSTASRIAVTTKVECRICWYVYDPASGDDVEQIPPGTPFAELPDHWRCPQCDATQEMFLPLENE